MRLKSLVLAMVSLAMGGCSCAWQARHRMPAVDYFERYVIVDVGRAPTCPLPKRRTDSSRQVPAGKQTPVWARSVAATDPRSPIPAGTAHLSIVDSFGKPSSGATITPSDISFGADGFSKQRITLSVTRELEHLRIKAEFVDKSARATTYSPFLVVSTVLEQTRGTER